MGVFKLSSVCPRECCRRPDPKLIEVSAEAPCPPSSVEFWPDSVLPSCPSTDAEQEGNIPQRRLLSVLWFGGAVGNQHHFLAQLLCDKAPGSLSLHHSMPSLLGLI